MKVEILGKEYNYEFSGFAPLYAYEVIMGAPFEGGSTRNMHVLMYATLLASNPAITKPSTDEFIAWLYEHPTEEMVLADVINKELIRRAELVSKKKE